MVFRLIDKLRGRREAVRIENVIEPAGRVYAIGDVHGAALLLERMLERIAGECRAEGAPARLVMMGDYIDRGDSSRDVLEILANLDAWPELAPVLLRGNHEDMLLDFLDHGASPSRWLRFGGLQTLLSYGVGGLGALGSSGDGSAGEELRAALSEQMAPHLDLLRNLDASFKSGNVFFSHAGADPALPLELQSERTLLWGTPSFLQQPRLDGRWVVHGHYVVDEPLAADGRIAIDTGAYFSQRLSAVRLDAGRFEFLTETMPE